jgi:hypothetical protein
MNYVKLKIIFKFGEFEVVNNNKLKIIFKAI